MLINFTSRPSSKHNNRKKKQQQQYIHAAQNQRMELHANTSLLGSHSNGPNCLQNYWQVRLKFIISLVRNKQIKPTTLVLKDTSIVWYVSNVNKSVDRDRQLWNSLRIYLFNAILHLKKMTFLNIFFCASLNRHLRYLIVYFDPIFDSHKSSSAPSKRNY